MEQAGRTLPIRLVPRKGSQIFPLIFFGFFFGFSLFWMAGASGILNPSDGSFINRPSGGDWIERLFPLFGLPFALIGIGGVTRAVLKLLPDSPYYHLEISSQGLLVRALFRHERQEWAKLPEFRTIEVERRSKNGTRIEHYAVAIEDAPAPDGAPRRSTHRREVVRIHANEYGAKNGKEDADALTAWFNQLREMAQEHRLDAGEMVEVPEGFRATASGVPAAPPAPLAGRSAPVIEQTEPRKERRPTVDRG